MKRKRMLQLLVILFIGVNFFLVYNDDEGKVDRIAYINEWNRSFDADLADKLYTPGVLTANGEEHLYFDKNLGSFQSFLVSEGDTVSAGTPLYSYRVHNYAVSEANLVNDIDKIEEEIAAIDAAIAEMERYRIPETVANSPTSFKLTEEELEVEFPQGSIDADMLKEQYIVEKEKERAIKAAELMSIENQLTELQTTGDSITVESPYDGKVKAIAVTLDDPIITIENAKLHAIGKLKEKERNRIEEGLRAEVTIDEMSATFEGTVGEVSESPKELKIKGDSIYPFHVIFDEEADDEINIEESAELEESVETETESEAEETKLEQLLPGYHANLTITIEESLGATTLFQDSIFANSVWEMSGDGKLVEQQIETGIQMDDMVEITSGIGTGDWVAKEPTRQFRDGASFITPLKIEPLTRDTITEDWKRGILTGLLSR